MTQVPAMPRIVTVFGDMDSPSRPKRRIVGVVIRRRHPWRRPVLFTLLAAAMVVGGFRLGSVLLPRVPAPLPAVPAAPAPTVPAPAPPAAATADGAPSAWVPGRPVRECMGGGKVIDNRVVRCATGHRERSAGT